MKKTVLFLLVSLALVTTLAVNGTFANEGNNIFKDIRGLFETAFGHSPTKSDEDALEVDVRSSVVDKNGDRAILAPAHYADEIDWESTPGVVTYQTYVQNMKNDDAYVRICIYVKKHDCLKYTEPEFEEDDEENKLFNMSKKDDDHSNYVLYTFDYNGKLDSDTTKTPPIQMKVALSKDTTNADMKELSKHGDFIQVYAYAIQAEAFAYVDASGQNINNGGEAATPAQALTLALGEINGFNPNPNLFK